jgi:hypothetical protein
MKSKVVRYGLFLLPLLFTLSLLKREDSHHPTKP